jgi:hypothetical protein
MGEDDAKVLGERNVLLYRCVVLRKVSVLISGQLGLRDDLFAE